MQFPEVGSLPCQRQVYVAAALVGHPETQGCCAEEAGDQFQKVQL